MPAGTTGERERCRYGCEKNKHCVLIKFEKSCRAGKRQLFLNAVLVFYSKRSDGRRSSYLLYHTDLL